MAPITDIVSGDSHTEAQRQAPAVWMIGVEQPHVADRRRARPGRHIVSYVSRGLPGPAMTAPPGRAVRRPAASSVGELLGVRANEKFQNGLSMATEETRSGGSTNGCPPAFILRLAPLKCDEILAEHLHKCIKCARIYTESASRLWSCCGAASIPKSCRGTRTSGCIAKNL